MAKFTIKKIEAVEILTSKKSPTLQVNLLTDFGSFAASVPSGTSKGKDEAVEKPIKSALNSVNRIIAPKMQGKEISSQKEADDFLIKLDGTKRKSRLGGNALLGVSVALCRAGAARTPLWKEKS